MKRKRPECDVRVVLLLFASAILICQCLLLQSSVVDMVTSPSKSMHSPMGDIGFESFTVRAFDHLRSIKKCTVPSFLEARTAGLLQSASVDVTSPAFGMQLFSASFLSLER